MSSDAWARVDFDPLYAVKTWRYLRLAMVGLVALLGISIAVERSKVSCFQRSISGYYFTPVRPVFVGVLIAIGMCLICLRGNTDVEDVLLNLAGVFAAFVAFVPTKLERCTSVKSMLVGRTLTIENNVKALLAMGALALIVVAVALAIKHARLPAWIPWIGSALILIAAAFVFFVFRSFFESVGHYSAAVPMFACTVLVVFSNIGGYRQSPGRSFPVNPYVWIAALMLASLLAGLVLLIVHWAYVLIALEAAILLLFAVFWVFQTAELWEHGVRQPART